jgi:NADPH:quinone reductase-like Zn-dependent oxidoreductase
MQRRLILPRFDGQAEKKRVHRTRIVAPADGRTVDFVVVPDRAQLSEIVRRARDGRVRTNIGNAAALDDAVAAFNPTERIKGKTIIRVRP